MNALLIFRGGSFTQSVVSQRVWAGDKLLNSHKCLCGYTPHSRQVKAESLIYQQRRASPYESE